MKKLFLPVILCAAIAMVGCGKKAQAPVEAEAEQTECVKPCEHKCCMQENGQCCEACVCEDKAMCEKHECGEECHKACKEACMKKCCKENPCCDKCSEECLTAEEPCCDKCCCKKMAECCKAKCEKKCDKPCEKKCDKPCEKKCEGEHAN